MSSRHLVVLPDDSARPILDAIGAASRSIRGKMFVFSDPALTGAMLAARRRGLKGRVMLNPARRSGEEDNEKTRKELIHGGSRGGEREAELQAKQAKAYGGGEATRLGK